MAVRGWTLTQIDANRRERRERRLIGRSKQKMRKQGSTKCGKNSRQSSTETKSILIVLETYFKWKQIE